MTGISGRRPGLLPPAAGVALLVWLCAGLPLSAQAQPRPGLPGIHPQRPTVDALSVVKVRTRAVRDARTAPALGAAREGTGVVIDADGLVVTIGYLVLEAETVELSTADGRTFPATVVGYDHRTGFGLLRPLGTLPIKPIEIGESATIADREPVLIVGFDGVAPAYVVSRRRFVGYWEYLLDQALYTAPATVNWQGAALLTRDGKLVGIGSLSVPDATGSGTQVPGNLFVPIDLLKPILGDLLARGRSSEPPRPWLGVHTRDAHGNVVVIRVSPGSPADAAALRPGDVLVRLGGQLLTGQADFYTRLWASGPAGVEVALDVLRAGQLRSVTVTSVARDTYFRAKRSY
jgi:serine protease Do